MVKMDIEGSEYEALRGIRGTLARLRPRLVTVGARASSWTVPAPPRRPSMR